MSSKKIIRRKKKGGERREPALPLHTKKELVWSMGPITCMY
jgi:hypothetical protein